MLNYKEHPSKSSHSRPDKNSIGTCQIFGLEMDAHNFGPLHVTGFTAVCNSSSLASLLPSDSDSQDTIYSLSEWSFSLSSSSTVGYNIDDSSETTCVTAVTFSVMFMVFVSLN
ncbi:hypothetical protein M9H77_27430 [Catharanthus roseus]|uniref:Uncharacterized protein n=1 Tax=Catharanthus roseus TaxID=4058 RepID=A0ACC0AF63_CATRO|nr:hypothetical protein M9H77_27430 [Catharanthus roseus]